MDIQPAPAHFHEIEMVLMVGNAGTDDPDVVFVIFREPLARAIGYPVLLLELYFLLKAEIDQIIVRREFVPERVDDLLEHETQRFLPRFDVHHHNTCHCLTFIVQLP
jgi:hypothetical protein